VAGITGLSSLKANIAREIKRKRDKLYTGLVKAGMYLQAQSMRVVPVDYGNLKASAFVASPMGMMDGGNKIIVEVGYTASYAIFVHEDPDAAHGAAFNAKYAVELAHAKALRRKKAGGTTGPFRHNRGENQQYKFLEMPYRRDHKILHDIVMAEVKS
jgi:bacteriophage HK97-gp10 putative tail-component